MSNDPDETKVAPSIARIDSRKPARGDACIVIIYGADIGRRLTLGSGAFEIGRSAKCDLFIPEESISRHHARISAKNGQYFVKDLGSTNGTFVNDEPVGEGALEDGDQIHVGRTIMKFMTGENIELHYHEEIYRLMTVDALTQAFNRRYFDEALEREFNRARRYSRGLSLIVFDIDHFKSINDTHGHLAGDALLRQLAIAVRPKLRREDIFARTGGEEFAIILPEVSLEGSLVVAEKVRSIIERTPMQHDQLRVSFTVSCGVAALAGTEAGFSELYKSADEKLYEAKHGGRNRVCG